MLLLDIVAILSIGLMIGVEFAVSAFINPTMRKLAPEPQAHALSIFAAVLGGVMPFWYGGNVLLLIAETLLRRHQPAVVPLVIAASLWTFIIIFTIAVLVPINNRIAKLQTTSLPEDWQQEHHRWDMLHHLRVALLTVAFLLALYAILTAR
jgi:uncharacterized membrane protein